MFFLHPHIYEREHSSILGNIHKNYYIECVCEREMNREINLRGEVAKIGIHQILQIICYVYGLNIYKKFIY